MAATREEVVLELVRADGFARIPALADRLQVSESTVRRILNRLEGAGKLSRAFGGAVPAGSARPFHERAGEAHQEKAALARVAAEMVRDGDSVFLGGGSTIGQMARFLQERQLQVVTNSVAVAQQFEDAPGIELLVTGGYLLPRHRLLVGPVTLGCLRELNFTWAFVGAAGFTAEALTDFNVLMAEANREALRRAEHGVALVDAGKFGRRHLATVCEVSELHTLVTGQLPEAARESFPAGSACRVTSVARGGPE
jgi:DeoR/GlpR family transcriptional regulator of sugar metabolism